MKFENAVKKLDKVKHTMASKKSHYLTKENVSTFKPLGKGK